MTPAEVVLAKLEGVRKTSNGWEALCPVHDDRRASLSVAVGDDERALLDCKVGCAAESVVEAIGLTMQDLFAPRNGSGRGRIVETYAYIDEHHETLYEVVRYEHKDFLQRRPDGNGGWIWKLGDARRVLYRLPDVTEAVKKGDPVFVVEGEKDVHSLETLGLVATTNPGGASKWRPEYSESLRGARVVIIPDNDEPGRKHGEDVARSLCGIAKAIQLVVLPDLPPRGDISEWLASGHNRDELAKIVNATRPWTAQAETEAQQQTEEAPEHNDPLSRTSDIANVRRFVTQHWEICRWLAERRRFVRYSPKSGVWLLDEVFDLWEGTVKSIYAEASDALDRNRRKQLAEWARQCENTRRFRDMLVGLQQLPDFSISVDEFDRDPFVINARNCLLDLRRGRLETREHRPDDYCFLQLGCTYDPHAVPETFLAALKRSLPDEDIRLAFQVIMGQALVAKPIQRLPFITGRGGQGKTTFAEAIARVFGSYAKTIDAATLAESHRNGAAPSPDIARLAGARLVMANDPKKNQHLAEGLVKNLTGGDTLTARYPYGRDLVEFVFHGTFVVRTNHLPRFDGGDYAMARRMLVIPFDVTIPAKERDEELPAKLEGESTGILNWLLEGAIAYLDAGLQLPKAVERATGAYIRSHDPLGRFVDERTKFDADGIVTNAELGETWQQWYEAEEGKLDHAPRSVPRTVRALKSELKRRFPQLENKRQSSDRGLKGLSLLSENAKG